MNSIKKDLSIINNKFLTHISYKNTPDNDYLNLLEISIIKDKILKIKHIFDNSTNKKIATFKKNFNGYIQNIEINYTHFLEIKNSTDILHLYLAIIIIHQFKNVTTTDNNENQNLLIFQNNSDNFKNNITKDINNLLLMFFINNQQKIKNNFLIDRNTVFNYLSELIKNDTIMTSLSWSNFKSYTIYSINISFDEIEYSPKIYLTSFRYIKINKIWYIYNNHFTSIENICKKNVESGYVFEINSLEILIKKLVDNWVYLDLIQLKDIFKDLMEHYKINTNELKNEYLSIKKKLNEATKKNNFFIIKELNKNFSIYHNLIKLKSFLSYEQTQIKIYLPFMFDFRGRLYFLSDASPTFYKEFRYCLHKGNYEKNWIPENHIFLKIIEIETQKYHNIIKNWKLFNFQNKSINILNSIIWILVGIAELDKSKIGKNISLGTFINEGIKKVNNFQKTTNIYKDIKLKFLIKILNEIDKDIAIKWLISKDATASCMQHIVKIVGNKTNDALTYCNLSSYDTWYDTYMYIIDDFNIKNNINTTYEQKQIINQLFTREFLKKTIMTENYSAKKKTCFDYFIKNFDNLKYSKDEQNFIKKYFYFFYDYIQKNNIILAQNATIIEKYFKENKLEIFLKDGTIVNLSYLKTYTSQYEINSLSKRYTQQNKKIINIINKRKTFLAIKANYIHVLDAALARWYVINTSQIVIHDCFMIDYRNSGYLIAKINEGMRISFHDLNLNTKINIDNIFSIFIIL